jgi:hypothetical protein
LRTVGYASCTALVAADASDPSMPSDPSSFPHPLVTFEMISPSVLLLHAGAPHMPVSHVLTGPTSDSLVLPETTSWMSAPAFRHAAAFWFARMPVKALWQPWERLAEAGKSAGCRSARTGRRAWGGGHSRLGGDETSSGDERSDCGGFGEHDDGSDGVVESLEERERKEAEVDQQRGRRFKLL